MFLGIEECHADQFRIFREEFGGCGVGSFVDFGNEGKCAARLQNAANFLEVSGQVRPEVVCFHGSDDVEGVVRERQLRNGCLPYLDAAGLNPACVCSLGEGDAFLRIVDPYTLP
jgi:hypothetical protein